MKFKRSTLMAFAMLVGLLLTWLKLFGFLEPGYREPFWLGFTGGECPYGHNKPGTLEDLYAHSAGRTVRGMCCIAAFFACLGAASFTKFYMDHKPKAPQ